MFASAAFAYLLAPLLFAQEVLDKANQAAGVDAESNWVDQVVRALLFVGAALVSLVLPYLAGVYLAKSMRMPSHGWKLGVIFCTIVCGALICAFGEIRLGVDLRGGANLVFGVKPADAADGRVQGDGGLSNEDMASLVQTLGRRINPSGTKEIVIRAAGNNQVEVIVPEVSDQEINDVIKQLTTAGYLRFRIVANSRDHEDVIAGALEQEGAVFIHEDPDKTDEDPIGMWAKVGREDKTKMVEVTVTIDGKKVSKEVLPLKYHPEDDDLFRDAKTRQIITIPPGVNLADNPKRGPEYKFERWLMENGHYDRENGFNDIEVLMAADDGYDVQGDHLRSVSSSYDDLAKPMITFNMTPKGAILMGGLTGEYMPDKNTGFARKLGILLDNELLSAPSIRGNISDRGQITGNFTQTEVDFLVNVLRAGRLPAILDEEPISRDIIDSQLGRDMKKSGSWAIGGSLVVVLLFMLLYYRLSGVIACLALVLNLLLIVAVMILLKAPFTLPGLAGIVLTVGMAVDANVLIYERMREEMARGAAMRMVIRNGFDRATTTIIDANLTTVITALVLYVVGTDQLRGFSVALILGLVISMFTAIFCSRVMFDIAERKWGLSHLSMMRIIGHTNIDFMKLRWVTSGISIAIILIGLVAVYFRGSDILDIDLQGGASVGLVLDDASMNTERVREILDKELKDERKIDFTLAKVRNADDTTQQVWNLDTSYDSAPKLAAELKKIFGDKLAMHSLEYEPLKPLASAGSADGSGASKTSTGGASDPDDTPPRPATGDSGAAARRSADDAVHSNDTGSSIGPYFVAQVDEPAPSEPAPTEPEPGAESDPPAAGETAEATVPPESTIPPESTVPPESTAPAEGAEAPSAEAAAPEAPSAEDPIATDPPVGAEASPRAAAPRPRFETTLELAHPIDRASLRAAMKALIDSQKLQISETDIDLREASGLVAENPVSRNWKLTIAAPETQTAKLLAGLKTRYDREPYFRGLRVVKSQVAGDKRTMAAWALIASFAGIIAYIWVRFQRVSFGLAAVVALVHDVLVTLAAIAVSFWVASALGFLGIDQFKISLAVVAAFLTIIGYSINDTIVIFDRIREIRGKSPNINAAMVNAAVNQTLSRSILTSLTVLMVVVILYIFGGSAIHPFAFAMVVGVLAGSYSTIFIASPVLLWLANYSKSHAQRADERAAERAAAAQAAAKEDKSLTA